MTCFAHTHFVTWKDGQFVDPGLCNVIVSYDGTNDAYYVENESDREAFEQWAYMVTGGDETEDDEISIRWF